MLEILLLLGSLFAPQAHAQAVICPLTPAAGTSNTVCANTAFVNKSITPSGFTQGDLPAFGSAGTLTDTGFSLAGALRSYLAGLTLSNDGSLPNSVLDIAAGVAT